MTVEPGRSGENWDDLPRIAAGDSFDFACAGCGGCCRGRRDLVLSGYDLYLHCGWSFAELLLFLRHNRRSELSVHQLSQHLLRLYQHLPQIQALLKCLHKH